MNIVLAVIAGIVVGSIVNMGTLMAGMAIIPLPEGIDPMDPESLAAAIPQFELRHFITPFLAHALGTLAGALVAAKVAKTHRMRCALGIGAWFLLGGAYMAATVGGPVWFLVTDLVLAYFPMAWIGGLLAGAGSGSDAG